MRSLIGMVAVGSLLLAGCGAVEGVVDEDGPPGRVATPDPDGVVIAAAETVPVPHDGDAADDAAIWVHPDDPGASTIIGTDKRGRVLVYDLSGRVLHNQELASPNNVDLRHGFGWGGKSVALVAVSERSEEQVVLFVVDPVTRGLQRIGAVDTGLDLYGVCLYRSARTGTLSVFGTAYDGELGQWELDGDGPEVRAEQVRRIDVGGRIEGCAADDELSRLYVGEEEAGLWRYGAEPDTGADRFQVDRVGRLAPDVEGVAIAAGTGHVVVSSQGSDDYAVYGRSGDNPYLGRFAITAGPVDATSHTDGLDVTAETLGPAFPGGLLVVQDDDNEGPDADRQNFKLVRWDDVVTAVGSG